MAQKQNFSQKLKNCRKSESAPLTGSYGTNTSAAAFASEIFTPSKDS